LPQEWKQVFGFAHFRSSEIARRSDATALAPVAAMPSPLGIKFGYESCARQLPCCHLLSASLVGDNGP
jgi:hypothetical protein